MVRCTGGRIEGEGSQALTLALGPLPDGDRVVSRAVQTYDSGEGVRWTEGGTGAEWPAPVLRLTGAAPATKATTTTTTSTTTTTVAASPSVGWCSAWSWPCWPWRSYLLTRGRALSES